MHMLTSKNKRDGGPEPASRAIQRQRNGKIRLTDNRSSPVQLNGAEPIQRIDDALMQRADELITELNDAPANVDVTTLKATIGELQDKYFDEGDNLYLGKWTSLDDAFKNNFIPILTNTIRPLLAHIKTRITRTLKGDTPDWVNNLSNIQITAGDGIAGGLAVGQDAIFVTPETGVELIKEGTAEFAIAHEVAHLVSRSIGIAGSKGLLRSDGALEQSGVNVESSDNNRAAKLEEIRADIFGVDMLSSYMDAEPSTLDSQKITGAISAPADNEHPSTDERKNMLTHFRGIRF